MNRKRRRRSRHGSFLGSVAHLLLAPVRLLQAVRYNAARWLQSRARKRSGSGNPLLGMLAAIGDLLILPFVIIFSGLWHLIVEWTGSRESRTLLMGLPAIFIGFGAIGAIAWAAYSPTGKLVRRYERSANESIRNQEWDEAKVHYEKLLSLRPDNKFYRYQVALVAEQQGDKGRAAALMSSLAPFNGGGYSLAHFWSARQLIRPEHQNSLESDFEKSEAIMLASRHYEWALLDDPDLLPAKFELAKTYMIMRQYDKSRVLLEDLKETNPEVAVELADVHRRMGDLDAAQAETQNAARFYLDRIRGNPRDIRNYDRLTECLITQELYDDALRVLLNGLEATKDRQFAKAIAHVYALKCQKLANEDGGREKHLTEIVSNLQMAISYDPYSPLALALITKIVNSDDLTSDEAAEMLRSALADGRAPAMVHFMLGTKYAHEGQHDRALESYRLALELNPGMPVVLNNMAWVICNEQEEPTEEDLARALDYVNEAIEINAKMLTFYDTRGQIYKKMGQIDDAIADFYRALPELGKVNPAIHDRLADCYAAKGETEQAQVFRDRAAELRASQAENDS